MNGINRRNQDLLRRFRRYHSIGLGIGVSILLLWVYFVFESPNLPFFLIAFVAFVVIGGGIAKCVTSLSTMTIIKPIFVCDIVLGLKDGHGEGQYALPAEVKNRILLFFEDDRNCIEGTIMISVNNNIKQTVVQLNPGWRRFSKTTNLAPVELRFDESYYGERYLEMDLKILSDSPFGAKSKNALRMSLFVPARTGKET